MTRSLKLGLSLLALSGAALAQNPPSAIGKGEGALNIVAWEGYAEDQWVKPFEAATGCQVNRKYAGSSDEMVALMRQGGGAQYDIVSASGDATLRLIAGRNVQPVNIALLDHWKDLIPQLQSPDFNTIKGVHYGISYEWGPNVLLYNTQKFTSAPTSWAAIYDKASAGAVTVPDNPIQIADAALYLSKENPALGISDPYELTPDQLAAVVALLKQQHALIKKYWALASDEIDLFQSRDASVGAAWPYTTITLQAAKIPVAETIPAEGATGWADTWMVSAKASHPNCAYLWMNFVTTPVVQAQQALFFGETPASTKACDEMNKITPGSCTRYHADASAAYFNQIKFWRTPLPACKAGPHACTSYADWQKAWQDIKG